MGLTGKHTFRGLRTSVVSHVSRHFKTKDLSPGQRKRITRAICHSEQVINKIYAPLNTVEEAAEMRALQLAAIAESPDSKQVRP
ncbi:hypothetical protein MATL_G00250920 [Megalops atlanticus]|uniref:Uncharacterized protein n=1 Tax=Megalops atlanticus TaxID=7932 RepID=A0A9D3PBD4_MEGAT|nr:hypothetical protein MATL_G00250920 [Megalops atlanticus]